MLRCSRHPDGFAVSFLVGPGGIEPPTSPLSGVRSSHLSYGPKCFCLPPWTNTGGAGRDRTGDLLNANQALSQLSYSPSSTGLQRETGSEEINRGQLDAETRRTSSRPFRITQNSKWRYQNGLLASCLIQSLSFSRDKPDQGLEWNGCFLLYPVYTQQGFFRKLHPRSLLERR